MSTQSTSSAASPTTLLVKALLSFGSLDNPDRNPDLDDEDEELTVSGVRAQTKSSRSDPIAAAAKTKGKGKLKGDADLVDQLKKLEVEEKPAPSAKSLRGLLRSSTHTVVLPPEEEGGKGEERVLTSWKMADYAYKRDPCPFPTRARGLFTERDAGDGGAEEYRIVARGYDKFFNVNEVSWTQVSFFFEADFF